MPTSVQKKIRDLERLVARKGGSIDAGIQQKLDALYQEKEKNVKSMKEKINSVKYHMVKFVERKKLTRKIRKVDTSIKEYQEKLATEASAAGGDSKKILKKIKKELADAEKQRRSMHDDLAYIMYYPRDMKYVSLACAVGAKTDTDIQIKTRAKAREIALQQRQKDIDDGEEDKVVHAMMVEYQVIKTTKSSKKSTRSEEEDDEDDAFNAYNNGNNNSDTDSNNDDENDDNISSTMKSSSNGNKYSTNGNDDIGSESESDNDNDNDNDSSDNSKDSPSSSHQTDKPLRQCPGCDKRNVRSIKICTECGYDFSAKTNVKRPRGSYDASDYMPQPESVTATAAATTATVSNSNSSARVKESQSRKVSKASAADVDSKADDDDIHDVYKKKAKTESKENANGSSSSSSSRVDKSKDLDGFFLEEFDPQGLTDASNPDMSFTNDVVKTRNNKRTPGAKSNASVGVINLHIKPSNNGKRYSSRHSNIDTSGLSKQELRLHQWKQKHRESSSRVPNIMTRSEPKTIGNRSDRRSTGRVDTAVDTSDRSYRKNSSDASNDSKYTRNRNSSSNTNASVHQDKSAWETGRGVSALASSDLTKRKNSGSIVIGSAVASKKIKFDD